jgi:hypothetical protein
MTEKQQKLADEIVNIFKIKEGIHLSIDEIHYLSKKNGSIQIEIFHYVVAILKLKGILESEPYTLQNFGGSGVLTKYKYFLTDKGWIYDNYKSILIEDDNNKSKDILNYELDTEIKKRTRDSLKWQYLPSKYWYIVMLLSAVVSVLATRILEQPKYQESNTLSPQAIQALIDSSLNHKTVH